MIRASCKHTYCKLCHGDCPQIKNAGTQSARSRNIAIFNQQKLKALQSAAVKIPAYKSKVAISNRAKFQDLPTEIRLQIYASCLEKGHRSFCGATEGGGDHPESRQPLRKIKLFASHRFPVAILLINKAIFMEAMQEIYRLIDFRLESQTPAELQQTQYWLTEHPTRYTSSLGLSFFACPSVLTSTSLSFQGNQHPKLTRSHVVQLTRMLSRMHNLRILDIELTITQHIKLQCLSHKKQQMVFRVLFLLRESVPARVQIRVNLDRYLRPNTSQGPLTRQGNVNIEKAEAFLIGENFEIMKSTEILGGHFMSMMWRIWGENPERVSILKSLS